MRAPLVRAPWRYRWSSGAAHVAGRDDRLVRVAPMLERVGDWRQFLAEGLSVEKAEEMRRHERSGRPLDSGSFVLRLEGLLDRVLRCQRPRPKRGYRRAGRARR